VEAAAWVVAISTLLIGRRLSGHCGGPGAANDSP